MAETEEELEKLRKLEEAEQIRTRKQLRKVAKKQRAEKRIAQALEEQEIMPWELPPEIQAVMQAEGKKAYDEFLMEPEQRDRWFSESHSKGLVKSWYKKHRKEQFKDWVRRLREKHKYDKEAPFSPSDKAGIAEVSIAGLFDMIARSDVLQLLVAIYVLELSRQVRKCDKGWNALHNLLEGVCITGFVMRYGGDISDLLGYVGLGITGMSSMTSLLVDPCAGGSRKTPTVSRSEITDTFARQLFFLGPNWYDIYRKVVP